MNNHVSNTDSGEPLVVFNFFLLKSIDIHQTTMNKYFAENHLNYKKKKTT